jgi:hypothetical protein
MGQTKEAIIAAEQQLSKDKLALENFNFDILKFTTHVRTYIRQIMSAGNQPTNQHYILIFSALKEVEQDEFKLIIMKLYEGWRTGQGEGADITVLQLLAKADSEYKRLKMLGQWMTKNKASELLGLQAKFDVFQTQFQALVAENKQIKQKLQASHPNICVLDHQFFFCDAQKFVVDVLISERYSRVIFLIFTCLVRLRQTTYYIC